MIYFKHTQVSSENDSQPSQFIFFFVTIYGKFCIFHVQSTDYVLSRCHQIHPQSHKITLSLILYHHYFIYSRFSFWVKYVVIP